MIVLGIDPGTRFTGYGVIESEGPRPRYVTSGTLKLESSKATSLEARLVTLFESLTGLIDRHQPRVMVIEKIFFAKNALSSLKLGHARGVALLCGGRAGLEIIEYNPTEVKQAVAGHGRASKEEVARMLRLLLGPYRFETEDESDALALAICHAHLIQSALHRRLEGLDGSPKT